jgi:hypothetical protein
MAEEPDTRKCAGCGKVKTVDLFKWKRTNAGRDWSMSHTCSECFNSKEREENSDHRRGTARASKSLLKWNYKVRAIKKYGGKCAGCGIDDPRILTFHHKNGGGKQDRMRGQLALYRRLAEGPKRKDIVVLCHNCHNIEHCNW